MTLTATGPRLRPATPEARNARVSSLWAPTFLAVAGAVAFLIANPPVGDLWAARARQSAASNGVGLTYWFSWFGGGSTPGNYSVLTPYLSSVIGALLGAIATVSITPLTWCVVQGTRHPVAASWAATVVSGFSLWSGRIPFATGSAISVVALIAVRDQRRVAAAGCAVLAVLVSPVSGAFIALGLVGTFLAARSHRAVSASTISAAGVSLVAIAVMFGLPGPEGFSAQQAVAAALGLLMFLVARPPRYLSIVILLALAACPVLVVVPNGMGSNFQRLVWICLPVAVVATARGRLPVALSATALAICAGALGTIRDVQISQQPMSSSSYYLPLAREIDSLPAVADYRLEVVFDGTHTAAYAMLGHANLARGYETQTDKSFNAILASKAGLNSVSYKVWLDNNAVGYVAVGRATLSDNPEYELVSGGHLRYLGKVWSDSTWILFRVSDASPIVQAPATVTDADQASMTIDVPCSCTLAVRVRWSRFLTADGPAGVVVSSPVNDGFGWTVFTAPRPGHYVLHGSSGGLFP